MGGAWAWAYLHVVGAHEHGDIRLHEHGVGVTHNLSSLPWVQQAMMARPQASIRQTTRTHEKECEITYLVKI